MRKRGNAEMGGTKGSAISSLPHSPTADDGALQGWELMTEVKLDAELVVLSACETGRGAKVPGEGLVGLTRALQYAGARSVVASQWKVDAASTNRLMVAFHRGLRAGQSPAQALRRAAVAQLRHGGARHPFYWAGFVAMGDADTAAR